MTIKRHTTETYTLTDDETGTELIIPIKPAEWAIDNAKITRDDKGRVIKLQYLAHDESPVPHDLYDKDDGGGWWRLGTSSKNDPRWMNDIYREALGLDTEWEPIYSNKTTERGKLALAKFAKTGRPHVVIQMRTASVPLRLTMTADQLLQSKAILGISWRGQTYEELTIMCEQSHFAEGEEFWQYFNEMLTDLQETCTSEIPDTESASKIVELIDQFPIDEDEAADPGLTAEQAGELVALIDNLEGECTDENAIPLSVYEHGGRVYSLLGQGLQCRFDTANGGAVLVPCPDAVEHAEQQAKEKGITLREALEQDAKAVLDDFNSWISGDVYGIVNVQYERNDDEGDDEIDYDDHDSVWGFIGLDYAIGAMPDYQ